MSSALPLRLRAMVDPAIVVRTTIATAPMWNKGNGASQTSSGRHPSRSALAAAWACRAPWVRTTTFGRPLLPEVKSRTAASSFAGHVGSPAGARPPPPSSSASGEHPLLAPSAAQSHRATLSWGQASVVESDASGMPRDASRSRRVSVSRCGM